MQSPHVAVPSLLAVANQAAVILAAVARCSPVCATVPIAAATKLSAAAKECPAAANAFAAENHAAATPSQLVAAMPSPRADVLLSAVSLNAASPAAIIGLAAATKTTAALKLPAVATLNRLAAATGSFAERTI